MGNKCVLYVQHLVNNTPEGIYRKLSAKYPLMYKHSDGVTEYRGFDVSDANPEKPIAEAILVDNIPVQIRYLVERPYWNDDLEFGGF